ncbi:MAG: TolC family protein [Gammaproteobacteria bacterium]|nr:TolC family protein [Gammaproteobacteria bacterium]MCY4219000.1 TolC family protein [Gammaproteobacteria bacterium]MCY4274980.1 TolC family protein [Gammaproteobacteria bacterium]
MIRPVAIILISIGLCSCGTNSPTTDIDQAAIESLPEVPDTWSSVIESVGDVQVGWIEQLGDPVLVDLVKEAQINNRNLQAASQNVSRSWALADQAGAGLSQTVTLVGEAEEGGLINNGSSEARYRLGLRANWELDVWGRIRAGATAAILHAQSVEADYVFSQNSLAATVARAYFLVIESNQQVAVTQKTVDALIETNRIVHALKETGLASSQDVALSRSDLANTKSILVATQGSQRNALRALEVLIGRYPSAELNIRNTLPDVPSLPPAGLPSTILERRPDIISAERAVATAFNRVKHAKVVQMPSISLTGSIGGASSDLSNFLNPANVVWQAATNLLAPLIDGGLSKAQVEQASAEQKQAIAVYAQTVLDAFSEIENSLDQNVVLQDRVVNLYQATNEANHALRIAQLQYNEGETDLLDVLTIQRRVFSTEADLATVERARLDEWIVLNLALGGSWHNNL